jgi:PAS domain-containing protein
MKMRLGVAKRRLFGSWLVISAIWVAGVGYRTWRDKGKMLKKIVTTTDAAHRDDTRVAQLERELRANEERWGAVMANPFMGITVLDHNHYFIMTNSTYQNMVGYTNDELKKLTRWTSPRQANARSTRVFSTSYRKASADTSNWSNSCSAKTAN